MINLKEAGQAYELRDGSLYTKLQCKLPETMLTQYHCWIFEDHKEESVLTLRTDFMTIASETVHGFTGTMANNNQARLVPRYGNQRTFFGETEDLQNIQKLVCRECGEQHGIWSCQIFAERSVRDSWAVAKWLQLCFRCLGEDHQGKSCPRSRNCGLDGCTDMHHSLLHKRKNVEPVKHNTEVKRLEDNDISKDRRVQQVNESTNRATFLTEGTETERETKMVVQSNMRPDFVGLRTVPIILKNGERSLRVNALLDEATTKTYVNADVTTKLGLQGSTKTVKVSVLNGQIETFETKPIDVTLQSLNGNVSMTINAYTVNNCFRR